MGKSIYYPAYDVSVDSETGEIGLPICSCTSEDSCVFMRNWINDGRPTHIEKSELKELVEKSLRYESEDSFFDLNQIETIDIEDL